ncbi:MAG TPA: Ig-like domain-containing protein [Planctomycetota bacterium]|nr:Ig-like domain-containing protein [Planctomycetota bacterium]
MVAPVLCLALASQASAGNPALDQLIFTGASSPGKNTLTFSGNVYSFTFKGDETITYQLDMSDPKVAGGMLRIRELTSDSYPMDEGGVCFRDAAGLYWMPSGTYKKTTLTGQSMSGTTLTLDYLLDFNGSHPFRYEIRSKGKQLRIRVIDLSNNLAVSDNFCGMLFGKATGIEHPVPVRMQGTLAMPITMFRKVVGSETDHYFTANMLDLFQCNSSDHTVGSMLNPVLGADSSTQCMDTVKGYVPLSNGKLAASLDDAVILVVSSRVRDVFVDSTAPDSPYHSLLSNRMILNLPSKNWGSYDQMFDQYLSLGMYSIAGYYFLEWSSSAIDPPAFDNSVGPDWSPAVDPVNFKSMLKHGLGSGALLGAYTAFNCMPATAPAWTYDASQIVKDATGIQKNWLGYPIIGVEASAAHAASESSKLKALGCNLAYLDIQTYGSIDKAPDGGHLDQSASSPWSKTNRKAFGAQKSWMDGMRTTLGGPLLGEGSICTLNSNMEYLYYGYVDSVQRAINTGGNAPAEDLPAGSPYAPTNWPIIPEYEWRVAVQRQVDHGNGFYGRFFGPSDGPGIVEANGEPIYPLTQDALDLYQAFLITYGHAGYVCTNGAKYTTGGYITHPDAAQTYFLTNALQSLYYNSPITTIAYFVGGSFKTFEDVLFDTESLETFRHVPVRMDFANGLRIVVNHRSTPLTIVEGGVSYTLPAESGWYAGTDDGSLLSFSAIPPGTGGKRIDYCKAKGQYEYFNGRGAVTGYGGIGTGYKLSKWTVKPSNLTVTENPAGDLVTSQGALPSLDLVIIMSDDVTLNAGDRTGLRAVATFDNGGLLDVTTLLEWHSTQPDVASVNNAGVVTALKSGQAKILAISAPGAGLISLPATVTVK